MTALSHQRLLVDLGEYVQSRGVLTAAAVMDPERPAEFDGVSITLNERVEVESRCYYLVHSFGGIVEWSLDVDAAQAIFDELRDAKAESTRSFRFERALSAFRDFEERTSEYAVFVLGDIGWDDVILPYTLFFRADIEAISRFHRTGRAPVWSDFLARWKADVESGVRELAPFRPRPVPHFEPRPIEKQEVKQERDGRGP